MAAVSIVAVSTAVGETTLHTVMVGTIVVPVGCTVVSWKVESCEGDRCTRVSLTLLSQTAKKKKLFQ